MFNFALISIVIVPILVAMLVAVDRRAFRGFLTLVVFLLIYNALYIALLYYLRHRWVG